MIINDLDGYYIVFDTKNWNTELDTLVDITLAVPRINLVSGASNLQHLVSCTHVNCHQGSSNQSKNLFHKLLILSLLIIIVHSWNEKCFSFPLAKVTEKAEKDFAWYNKYFVRSTK